MLKRLILIIFFIAFRISGIFAQQFGNEWINFNQKYAKIKVTEESLYKISYDDIIAKNLFTGSLDPNKFQLFNKGIQIPLYITGTNDGVFNQGDFIYFFGTKNNGSLDRVLYTNYNDLPNEQVSLYSDDNFYFLTYNPSQNGLRYQTSNETNISLATETFILTKERLNFTSNYYGGEFILAGISPSEFVEGEGYLGDLFGKGQSISYTLNTSNYFNVLSYKPQISFYIAGRSNAASSNTSGNNHHLRVLSSGVTVFDSLYRGYKTIRKTAPIHINSSSTSISFSAIDDIGAVTDFQAPGYLEISFTRNLEINNIKNLSFSFPESKSKGFLDFTNNNLSNALVLEKNGNSLVFPIYTNNNLEFVLNNVNPQKEYFLTSFNTALSTILEDVAFRNLNNATSKPYLMITHSSLLTGALNYKQYNESIGTPTVLVTTDDLYNEFYYGFHHPIAIKNYCNYLLSNANTKPQYLLLLGRGFEIVRQNILLNLVPTFGYPASDNMLTAGLNGSNLEPALPTGRVPARNNEEINNYLDKLRAYNNLPNEIWRKKLLQATGGTNISESMSFGSYQNNFYNNSKEEFFGASRLKVSKNVATPITENLTERIIKETKEGIALLSYFGHGSATGTEISFGKVSDQQNKDRPTIYLVNGCSTGACFSNTRSLGEEYLLGKDFGAVGWIGTTSEGVASYLGTATSNFHQNWFKKLPNSSIAIGIKEGLKTFQNPNDKLNVSHTRQYIYLGDPTLKFYSPEKPDYFITNSSIFLKESNPNATSSTLELYLKIENIGKALNDSLTIKIDRTLPDNSVVSLPIFKIKPVYNTDTISVILSNISINVTGNNKVTVKVDTENKFDELNELNNQAIFELFLPGNGIKNLFPINNSVYSKATLILKSQPDNLFTKNAEYLFEIDTVPDFTSGFKKSSQVISASLFPQWAPNIILENGKVYFWRSRLNLPFNQGGSWTNSSFTFLDNVLDGFSQSKIAQINNVKLNNIEFNNQTGTFTFKNTFYPTSIYTEGDDGVSPSEKRFRTTQSVSFSNFSFEGITLLAMNNLTPGKFLNYPSPFNSTNGPLLVNGYTGQFFWNINDPVQVDSLIRFINQIPKNYHVIGFNGTNAAINTLPQSAKNALRSCGLNKFDLISKGEPYMFWGIKGAVAGSALEFTADYNSIIPPRKQTLQHFKDLSFPLSNGFIETEPIGPSQEWKSVDIQYLSNSNDKISFNLIGINKQGQETVLMNNITNNSFNISNVSPLEYPHIKIRSNFLDTVEYSLPSLKHWRVDYKPYSEVSINPENLFVLHSERIVEGDSLKFSVAITNLYDYPTDSIKISVEITRPNRQIELKSFTLPSLTSNESFTFNLIESTRGFVGQNRLRLLINSSIKDLYSFNNIITKEFEILGDKQEPFLNVLFDGKSIINGEIVSPKPHIVITNVDENKFLLLNDTTTLDVYLKKGIENDYKKIPYSSNLLKFTPAISSSKNSSQIEFTPDVLPDGVHSLKLTAKDASGNKNKNDYLLDFEVINESSISNFYPYPNPVVNSMKFVFTLTGLSVPDKIKITIYNASGKVIRTIFKEEIGNIKIGNNISDFTWDGTDQFGDRLANGVYFYKIDISDSNNFTQRKTKGDLNFKNNMGKIYLLR